MPKSIKIITCNNCSISFKKQLSEIKRSKTGNHYCSTSCAASFNNRSFPKRRNNKKCSDCNATMRARKKRCDICLSNRKHAREQAQKIHNKRSTYAQRTKNKIACVKYKGGKCSICGYNKCLKALNFHHIIPSTKSFGISERLTYSWGTLKQELDKCALLCANCHAEVHAGITKIPGREGLEPPPSFEATGVTTRGNADYAISQKDFS